MALPTRYLYPRPEYPRPDRQRGRIEGIDWLNLNGPWLFRFDRGDQGYAEEWFRPEAAPWQQQIIVPYCWESLAAWGEGDAAGNQNYFAMRVFRNPLGVDHSNHRSARRYEVGWYRREVVIPDNGHWKGKRAILTIGAADFFTDVWCNGVHLGHHEGGYAPFEFDLTEALQPGPDGRLRGDLVVRVEDPMDNHEQPVGKQWRWYTTVSGIWQTVFIEPRSAQHIGSFRTWSTLDQNVQSFFFRCPGVEAGEVEIEIQPPEGPVQRAVVEVRGGEGTAQVQICDVFWWNPNEPYLYDVVYRLRVGGEIVDVVRSYFGMRHVDFAPKEGKADQPSELRLNGAPRYLRGALHQSYYPEGVYTAGDCGRLKQDILMAQEFGFNFLRIHIKADDPILLYFADKYGMLLMADFPNFGEGGDTPTGRRRFEEMMRDIIDRDFNHPSIFTWCLFNETWGFGGQVQFVDLISPRGDPDADARALKRQKKPTTSAAGISASAAPAMPPANVEQASLPPPHATSEDIQRKMQNLGAHAWVLEMWRLAKELDPTRLIEDMSVVYWDHLDYYAHAETDINSWHFYLNDYEKAREHVEKVVRSTYLGSGFNYVPGFEHRGVPLINSEYGGVGALDGDRDASWSFKFLTNELRRHPEISAYIYTELHDVEWECNGFLNYDRTRKHFGYDPRMVNESNVLPVDAPPIRRCAPGEVVQVPVSSSHFSTREYRDVMLSWRLGGIDTLGHVRQDLQRGLLPIPFPHRAVAPAHTVALTMPEEPMLCTLDLEALSDRGEVIASNFVQFFVTRGYPPQSEERERGHVLRQAPYAWSEVQWSRHHSSVEEAKERDMAFGLGCGHFEYVFAAEDVDLLRAKRIRVLCEASSHREDTPQTDGHICPTTLEMHLNSVLVYSTTLNNHPFDTRGALSYLRGDKGCYGYLCSATVEGELLHEVTQHVRDGFFHLRISVPPDAMAQGGLTVYGAECGRHPICPTLSIEW